MVRTFCLQFWTQPARLLFAAQPKNQSGPEMKVPGWEMLKIAGN